MKLVGFSLCLVSCVALAQSHANRAAAAVTPPPLPRMLSATETIPLGVPMFGATGNPACDASGDLYFALSAEPGKTGPFLGIKADGSSHQLYLLPSDLESRYVMSWAVTPAGVFYVLWSDFKAYKLIQFSDDGSVGSITSVEIPENASIQHLAISNAGTMYVSGYMNSQESIEKPRAGVAALFDASGKLTRDLSAAAPKMDIKAAAERPAEGDAIAGSDQRFYILQPSAVLSLSQAGEIEHVFKFAKPDPKAAATSLYYSDGLIAIGLFSVHPTSQNPMDVGLEALLLDAHTGEQRGDFIFAPGLTNNLLCFTRRDGFALKAIAGNQAAKQTVLIR